MKLTHEGKNYQLAPAKITGKILDIIAPLREQQKVIGQNAELLDIALESEELYELINPLTMQLREGVDNEMLMNFCKKNKTAMKALLTPTAKLTTDKGSRAIMAQMIRVTVDRTKLPDTLCALIDSEDNSEFWSETADVEEMIKYVDSFCRRARI